MAATSTAHTATALTPPSSSHGDSNGFQWDFSAQPVRDEVSSHRLIEVSIPI